MHKSAPQRKVGKVNPKSTKGGTKRAKTTKVQRKSPLSLPKRHISTAQPLNLTSVSAQSTSIRQSHALSQHLDTPYNNANTKFEFTPESMKKIETVLKKFPANYKQSAVMPVLFIAQEQNENWLPLVAMDKVAELLDMPKMRVYEVATFYTMYNRDKVGKFHIQVCGTTTCMTMGARDIKKAAKKFAGVAHDGEISKDGLFCITEVECLGACTNAPMIQVNNHEFYENLTTDTIVSVMKGLVDGSAKVGPQNGQKVAEGPHGPKTLVGYKEEFPKFNFDRVDAKLAEMKAAAQPAAAPPQPQTPPPVTPKPVEVPKAEPKKAAAEVPKPAAEAKKAAAEAPKPAAEAKKAAAEAPKPAPEAKKEATPKAAKAGKA